MPQLELLSQIQQAAEQATEKAEEYSGVVGTVREYIIDNFGSNGLIAAYVLVSVIVLLLVAKLAKVTFSTLKYVVIPAIVLAVLATFFLNISFLAALPVSTTVCSLFLLFRG